jgi:hypothetical protein
MPRLIIYEYVGMSIGFNYFSYRLNRILYIYIYIYIHISRLSIINSAKIDRASL